MGLFDDYIIENIIASMNARDISMAMQGKLNYDIYKRMPKQMDMEHALTIIQRHFDRVFQQLTED